MVRVYNLLEEKREKRFYAEVNLLVLLSFFIAAMINLNFPVLRFADEFANHLFMLIVLFIPALLFINGFFLKGAIFKMLNLCIFIIPSIIAALFVATIVLDTFDNVQHLQVVEAITTADYNLKIYHSDSAALGGEGTLFRQEKEIFPGLLLVKDIYRTNHHNNVKYKFENNSLSVEGERRDLKASLYF